MLHWAERSDVLHPALIFICSEPLEGYTCFLFFFVILVPRKYIALLRNIWEWVDEADIYNYSERCNSWTHRFHPGKKCSFMICYSKGNTFESERKLLLIMMLVQQVWNSGTLGILEHMVTLNEVFIKSLQTINSILHSLVPYLPRNL